MGVFPSAKAIAVFNHSLLCYQRDNLPTINDPNSWDMPGSDLKSGESFEDAIERSFREQFGIIPGNIVLFKAVKNNQNILVNVFLVRLTKEEVDSITFGGWGQKFDFFPFESIQAVNLTPPARKFIESNLIELKQIISSK